MHFALPLLLSLLPALPAEAQTPVSTDLTLSMAPQRYRICNDRPPRPEWVDTLTPRQAYRAVTLMELYELRAFEAIIETRDCSCGTRFPAWDVAEAEYQREVQMLSSSQHTQIQRDWRRQAAALRHKAQPVCEAQGNW